LHVFLEADAGVLRERLNARVTNPHREWDQAVREFGLARLTPAELADEVLAAAGLA
jgi:hypothetical protein